MRLNDCKVIDLPHFVNESGELTFIQNDLHIPFAMQRIYYLYGVPKNAERGAHGHRELQQLIVAVSGSFEIVLDDGHAKKSFTLSSPYQGLYVCPMIWRELHHFSAGAVCLVLASLPYDENDYIRHYDEFIRVAREKTC